ncbi:NAD(P)-binding domain-containing protein [Actinocorallia lasiicapitis]
MRIAVLGTGGVGRALAGRFAELGHTVTVGTRDVAATLARTEPDQQGQEGFGVWAARHGRIGVATLAEAAAGAEIVVNASSGQTTLQTLEGAGAGNLAGKILIDVTNPLDFSQGFPPTLFVKDTDSLAERIQAAFPDALVVKTFNTMTADLMVHPETLADGDHTIFVSGDDAGAKKAVAGLLTEIGHRDVVDLGDLSTARGTEMLLPLWLRIMQATGTSHFNLKLVR